MNVQTAIVDQLEALELDLGGWRNVETQLVARAQSGDPDAVGELYAAFAPNLLANMIRRTHNPDRAEDLVQEAFEKVILNMDRYEDRGYFGAWLGRIAINCDINDLRKAKREVLPGDESWVFVSHTSASDTEKEALETVFGEVNAREVLMQADFVYRDVIWEVAVCGKSCGEAADELGIPVGTVRSRLKRGLDQIRSTYGLEPGQAKRRKAA